MDTPAISTKNLTRFYGAHRGIEDVNLEVAQGEVFGFLGPNGAGKTTLIRLMLDLLRPSRGNVKILGRHCHTESLAVRRLIGFLPSEFHLYDNMTGRENLAYLGGLGAEVPWPRAEAIAKRLQVDLTRRVGALSHGTKQKLAIILAFMHESPLLILDEPTSGLDPLVQQEFFGLIAEARTSGHTVFLSSHNLTEVERVCDRVASIREGRLIAVQDIAELQRSAVRVVKMTCAESLDAAAFLHLDECQELEIDGRTLCCSVQGSLGALIAAATPFGIVDLLSREPSLEELFLTIYGEQGGNR